MWFEPTGLEQATAEPVARHKARRFSGLVVDLCSGIGGDALALAAHGSVLAVDRDQGMCRRARWNASVYDVGERVAAVRGRAEGFPIPKAAWVHIDPDRRAQSSRRARDLRLYAPGLDFLHSLPARARGGALKLGPASDFATHFSAPTWEVEIISLSGECKEATVWFGELVSCGRRATVLPANASWTDRDGPTTAGVGAGPLSAWVYDPDPALVRSGLLDSVAAAHGLGRCAAGVDFLTGPERIDSPYLAGFEVVEEVLPFDLKTLRRLVAGRGLGPLEIKVKGLDIRPEGLRALNSGPARPPPGDALAHRRVEPARADRPSRFVRALNLPHPLKGSGIRPPQ